MKFTLSSTALSCRMAAFVRFVNCNEELDMLGLFAGCGVFDHVNSVVAERYDYNQVITYFKEAREKNNNSSKETTKSVTDIFSEIINDSSSDTEGSSRETATVYKLRHGEHGQNRHGEQNFQHRTQGYYQAYRSDSRGLWPRRGTTCVQGDGAGDGHLSLVGSGGKRSHDELFQRGALARAARRSPDGVGEAPRWFAQCEHQPASGADGHCVALLRRGHRPSELVRTGVECRIQQSITNLKSA